MQEIQRYQIYTAYIVLNTQLGSILGRYIELHVYGWQKWDKPGKLNPSEVKQILLTLRQCRGEWVQ